MSTLCFFVVLFFLVYGPSEAAPDASQTPARLDLPAARPPETYPPLHLYPGPVFGSPVDPQVYSGCHHLPRYGEQPALPVKRTGREAHQGVKAEPKPSFFRCSFLQILALVAVRKAMDYLFSQHDLSYLDDVIPEKDKKKKEDEKKKKQKKKGSIDSEMDFVSVAALSS